MLPSGMMLDDVTFSIDLVVCKLIEEFVDVKNILEVGPIEGNFQPTSKLWLAQLEFAFSSSVSLVKLAGCLAQFSRLVRLSHFSCLVWLAHFSCLVWLTHFSLLV